MIQLVLVIQTCLACPSQWNAWDATGQYYYLRYRHGRGTVEIEPGPDVNTWQLPYPNPHDLVTEFVTELRAAGHTDHDGMIELDEFLAKTGLELAPEAVVVDWDTFMAQQASE